MTRHQRLIGPPAVHDARIAALTERSDSWLVELESHDDGPIEFEFLGVQDVVARDPVKMMVYSLIEVQGEPSHLPGSTTHGHRRFVFVNWDEGDSRELELVARECRWRWAGEVSWKTA